MAGDGFGESNKKYRLGGKRTDGGVVVEVVVVVLVAFVVIGFSCC